MVEAWWSFTESNTDGGLDIMRADAWFETFVHVICFLEWHVA